MLCCASTALAKTTLSTLDNVDPITNKTIQGFTLNLNNPNLRPFQQLPRYAELESVTVSTVDQNRDYRENPSDTYLAVYETNSSLYYPSKPVAVSTNPVKFTEEGVHYAPKTYTFQFEKNKLDTTKPYIYRFVNKSYNNDYTPASRNVLTVYGNYVNMQGCVLPNMENYPICCIDANLVYDFNSDPILSIAINTKIDQTAPVSSEANLSQSANSSEEQSALPLTYIIGGGIGGILLIGGIVFFIKRKPKKR